MGFLIWYIVYSAYICDIMEERKWFEELPDLCPPSDAMACSGVFYLRTYFLVINCISSGKKMA